MTDANDSQDPTIATPTRPVDLYQIHMQDHLKLSIEDLSLPFPYWQQNVYEDVSGVDHAELGLPDQGALITVRPDGYVGIVTSLEGGKEVTEYLDRILFCI